MIAILACARLGAVHTVVFAGFSAEALADRLIDSQASLLVTAVGTYRGDKWIPLQKIAENGIEICESKCHYRLAQYIVCQTQSDRSYSNGTNGAEKGDSDSEHSKCKKLRIQRLDWHELMSVQCDQCPVEWVDAEDQLFLLYTR